MNPATRQLTILKILSRLLSHELHAQGSAKTIQLSRDEVLEIQTTLDLYIEEAVRKAGSGPGTMTSEPQLVTARGVEIRN
ncbi:MAG: hypothetical protein SGI72_05490 [Planctomycetota bacterium]|nr:hypothetical protein [Planctomycetota bacterium]